MTSRNGNAQPLSRDHLDALSRDHHIPLRRQLAAGLEAAIRDGHLGAGARLPSSRDMAARLGVHRSTVMAAYARLRRKGWVAGGPGGRMKVRPPPEDLASAGVLGLLAEARRTGIRRDRAIASLESAVRSLACPSAEAVRPLLLAEPRPGLRAALAAELEARLEVRVAAVPHPGRLEGLRLAGPVLLRAGLAARIGTAERELIPLRLAGGTRERGIARRCVRTGLVTLVTGSAAVRAYASELAAREFGRGISFAAVDPHDASAMIRLVAASRLVFFDEASRSSLPPTRVPALPVRLLDEAGIERLRSYLGLPAQRPGTERTR